VFDIAVLSAYISIGTLAFLSLVLYNYESKRTLVYAFIIESVVIVTSLFHIREYLFGINHIFRIISSLFFLLYAIKLKK
jgi:hypothetical protein